ncbi:hypothetical protein BDV26DRAFT_263867, partial [Aspergillus bertholletiae]
MCTALSLLLKVEGLHPVRTLVRSCGCISIFVGRYVRISCIQSFPYLSHTCGLTL